MASAELELILRRGGVTHSPLQDPSLALAANEWGVSVPKTTRIELPKFLPLHCIGGVVSVYITHTHGLLILAMHPEVIKVLSNIYIPLN